MKNPARKAIIVLLSALFCLIEGLSLTTMLQMQGNARVINYTGIVRGATQRLVKQELNGLSNDELIRDLDGIVEELSTGKGENGLTALPDLEFQRLLGEMRGEWAALKTEIGKVRQSGDKRRLFELSEAYFELADQTVSAAERYSEQCSDHATLLLVCLNAGFVVVVVLFWIYGRRQKKVQAALDMAENASRAKSEFLSRMSHEIRTPMNGIIGMTAVARVSVDDQEKLLDCLSKIELSSDYLLALINDILDMSRIESGKINLEHEPFELPELCERISGLFRQKAADGGITYQVDYSGLSVSTVVGDALRITQVLVNIVSNALKFTPSGGRVTVEVRQKAASDSAVTLDFIVTDTGAGISEEFQKRLFEPFEQERAATARQYGGTGLGLAISNRFVEMMGGKIAVHSKVGEGSRFIVSLTLDRPARQEALSGEKLETESPNQPCRTLAGVCVLLAEDNEINAEIVTVLLESGGAEVDWVNDGEKAVKAFGQSPAGKYAVILMDVHMPVMGGLEATRAIRGLKRPDAAEIPIVGLSANAFQEDVNEALQSGMNGYLPKPIDVEKLLQTVGRFL